MVRDANFLLRKKLRGWKLTTRAFAQCLSLSSFEPRFRLCSGCSVTAFDRLQGTRVVAGRLPRTRSSKRTAVVATPVATF